MKPAKLVKWKEIKQKSQSKILLKKSFFLSLCLLIFILLIYMTMSKKIIMVDFEQDEG